jgi:hypothetical protein
MDRIGRAPEGTYCHSLHLDSYASSSWLMLVVKFYYTHLRSIQYPLMSSSCLIAVAPQFGFASNKGVWQLLEAQ